MPAAGTAGRHVGQEIDIQAAYNYSPQLQIGTGYAITTDAWHHYEMKVTIMIATRICIR